MATIIFRGDAPTIAKVVTYSFGGTWEANDKIRATFGTNGHYYDFTAGSTTTATVVSNLVTAWNALSSTVYPEFAEITASGNSTTLTLTHDSTYAGTDFTCTLTPLESDGSAADSQTIEGAGTATTGTVSTANSGPGDWNVAANWSTGSVPTTGDTVILENSNVNITCGFAQSAVTLAAFYIRASYTGQLGNKQYNTRGTSYREYRSTHLAISATVCEIGAGEGNGSGLIRLDFGSNANTTTVWNSAGSVESGSLAVNVIGSHSSNKLYGYGGYVSVGGFGGQTAQYPVIGLNGATGSGRAPTFYCGTGLNTNAAVTINAGAITLNAGSASVTSYGGTSTLNAGAHPIISALGGTVVANTSSTLGATSITVGSAGTLDFDQSVLTKTSSLAISAHRGATIKNGNGTAASMVVTPVGCRIDDVNMVSPIAKAVTYAS